MSFLFFSFFWAWLGMNLEDAGTGSNGLWDDEDYMMNGLWDDENYMMNGLWDDENYMMNGLWDDEDNVTQNRSLHHPLIL